MKYTDVKAFSKHLREAGPDHFSPIYLVIAEESFIREEALTVLTERMATGKAMGVKTFDGTKLQIEELFSELNSFTFFSGKRVIVLRRLDEVPKAALKQLESYLEKPHPDVHLILTAAEINRATKVFKLCEKNGVVLDVPEEKPWEKQKTMQTWLVDHAQKIGSTIAPDAAQFMLQQLGTDTATLHQELEKLSLYVGNRKQINIADIQAVCSVVNTQNIWQLGDALMQRDAANALKIGVNMLTEGASFFQLIRQIRTQFQTKFQICSILTNGGSPVDVATQYPYMKGRILDQNCHIAQAYGMDRFRKALLLIDETEALAKSVTSDEQLLTQRLIAHLTR